MTAAKKIRCDHHGKETPRLTASKRAALFGTHHKSTMR